MVRSALQVALLLQLGQGTSNGGPSIVDRLLNASGAFGNAVASLLNGKCWGAYTEAVQVRRKPMCLSDGRARAEAEAGRQARIAALKAIGMSIGMLQHKQDYQQKVNQTVDRMQAYAYRLQVGTGRPIIDLTTPVLVHVRPQARARSQYQLSEPAVLLLSATNANTEVPMFSRDPIGMGLLARSAAVSLALDRVTATVSTQLVARTGALNSGHDKGAGAARAMAEQQAIAAYNAAVRNAAETQHAQLSAYITLEREKSHVLERLQYANPKRWGW